MRVTSGSSWPAAADALRWNAVSSAGSHTRSPPAPEKSAADAAVASLAQSAQRLSQPVPNPVSGYGLVGAELRRQPALAGLRD